MLLFVTNFPSGWPGCLSAANGTRDNADRTTAAALVRLFASLTAENKEQTTANRARQEVIDDNLLLEETPKAMTASINADNDAICRNPRNPPPQGDGIADACMEMELDYEPGRDDLTLSDFVCALTSPNSILLCGVLQRIHFIQREHSKHTNRAHRYILAAPIDPDKFSSISHLRRVIMTYQGYCILHDCNCIVICILYIT